MKRTTLALIAALAAPPSAAQAQPSDMALGVALAQWMILHCEQADLPPDIYAMVQEILPIIPMSEREEAYDLVESTAAVIGDDRAACVSYIALMNGAGA